MMVSAHVLDSSIRSASDEPGSTVAALGTLIRVVLATILVSLILTVLILLYAGQIQDETATDASLRQLEGLFTITGHHLVNYVQDYATWDEAIERVTAARDLEWWDQNPGQYAVSTFGLALSLAVDGDDRVYFVSTPDGTRAGPFAPVASPSLAVLLDAARAVDASTASTRRAAVGLVEHAGVLYLAAASPFLSQADLASPDHAPGAVLLFGLSLDQGVLPVLDHIMGHLELGTDASPGPGMTQMPLTLVDGTSAGVIAWTPPAPGRSMIMRVLPIAILAFLSIAGLTLVFAARARRLAQRLTADEAARRELALRYESILETAGDGIFGIDAKGRILFVNAAASRMLGSRPDDLRGRDASMLIHPRTRDDPEGVDEDGPLRLALTQGRAEMRDRECFRRADGGSFPVEYVATPVCQDGRASGAVVVFRDITQRRETEEEMIHRANYDALTGLPNRNLLLDRLDQELKFARREHKRVGLLFIDLDDFKRVNDSLGHQAGDLLLRQVAERLRAGVRETDTVARLGGDELVVLLPYVQDSDDARMVAMNLLQRLQEPFAIAGHAARIGASIGIAFFPEHGTEPKTLLDKADHAMYQAKAKGRGVFQMAK